MGDHQGHVPFGAQADEVARTNTSIDQCGGGIVHLVAQLGIGHLCASLHQGHAIAVLLRDLIEELRDALVPRIGDGRSAPFQRWCDTRHAQVRCAHQIADTRFGTADDASDQRGELIHPFPHRLLVEQVGVVAPLQGQAIVAARGVEEQFEVLVAPGIADEAMLQPLEGHTIVHVHVDVEHHRHQGHTTRDPRQVQFLQQGTEGVLLVVEGIQHRGAALFQMVHEGPFFVDPAAQGEQVHTMPHEVLHAEVALTGRR